MDIAKRVRVLDGQLVLLDSDLASLYGVAPIRLAKLVRHNQSKFPVELSFPVRGDNKDQSLAFTEHGVILAATLLNSSEAIAISLHVVSAIVQLRETLPSDAELTIRIAALEKSVATLDAKTREQFEAIYRVIGKMSSSTPKRRSGRELH